MKAVAGEKASSTDEPRVATRRGLPLIIPGVLRVLIEERNPVVIRGVLTLLSIYRVMRSRPKMKLSSITGDFVGMSKTLLDREVEDGLARLPAIKSSSGDQDRWAFLKKEKTSVLKPVGRMLLSQSAGPNSEVSCLGWALDAHAYLRYPKVQEAFRVVTSYTGVNLYKLLIAEQGVKLPDGYELDNLHLGRLSKKFEAAGKVRVFAITDAFTQSALYPLHDYLFRWLCLIPTDGTFDQYRPLKRLMEMNIPKVWSFDLSAATDRLPIDFQVQILSTFMGREFAEAWKSLLVDRPWHLRQSKINSSMDLYYAVGQPMGALSSWAMLALSHHVIVQIAAQRAGKTGFFDLYAVLGDDVVIADEAVATNYLALMKFLGLEINLDKSLQSEIGVAEFAKRLISPEGEFTPAGPKALLGASRAINQIDILFRDLVGKGVNISLDFLNQLFQEVPKGFSRKSLGKLSKYFTEATGPWGLIPSQDLTPLVNQLALDSLNEKERQSLMEVCTGFVENWHLRQFLSAQESWSVHSRECKRMMMQNPLISGRPLHKELWGCIESKYLDALQHPYVKIGTIDASTILTYGKEVIPRFEGLGKRTAASGKVTYKTIKFYKELHRAIDARVPAVALKLRETQAADHALNGGILVEKTKMGV